MAVQIRQRK